MKAWILSGLAWFAILASSHVGARGFLADDHLVPVEQPADAQSPEGAYERLWRQKLLVTPGEIARSVHLPGNVGVETAVSVYRSPLSKGEYRVTATQTSASLWRCVAPDAPQPVNPDSIEVVRLEAALPETTALAIQKVWRAMLLDVREPPASNEILLEGSTEIFSAVAANGQSLIGQFQGLGQRNTAALSALANLLLQYCDLPETRRVEIADRIEKAASDLLARVASDNGSKNHNSTLASSLTPRRQSISQSTAGAPNSRPFRKPARRQSVTRLGSSIDDFRSRWGPPIREETLVRTARVGWRWPDETNAPLPGGIFEAEVSFLDGIACEMVLRSKEQMKKSDLVNLGKALVPSLQMSDLARLKFRSDGSRTYALRDGGYITAWLEEKPAVMVIRNSLFLQNHELFDQEAAKVRPLTSNH